MIGGGDAMIQTNYRAFISYNHRDRDKAVWLQRKLENYRVPRKLVDLLTSEGSVPRRLAPIFRDEECMAAGDLSEGVKEAIRRSRFLIVVCSPEAAGSDWVDREIRLFKSLHGESGEKRVLAAVVRGEGAEAEGDPLVPDPVLPAACKSKVDARGELTGERAEPLAADLRFGERHAKKGFLKLVSGLIGVGLDDLLDRDHRRRLAYSRSVAGLAVAVAAMTGALAFVAVDARNEARMQRNEAEGLVEFMLTELKQKLDAVGRLDALSSVGERALQYYAAQDKRRLDPDSLGRRARAQLLVGEIDNLRGDLDSALAAYEQAAATTEEQLRRDPGNPQRIFDHAQSVFWVGYIAWQRGDLAAAETQFLQYRSLAEKLISIDPEKDEWVTELAYAHGNLGTIHYDQRNWTQALAEFDRTLSLRSDLATRHKEDVGVRLDLAQSLSWSASVLKATGRYDAARDHLNKELAIYRAIGVDDPDNKTVRRRQAIARRVLAAAMLAVGDVGEARGLLDLARRETDRQLAIDPDDTRSIEQAVSAYTDIAELELSADNIPAAAEAAGRALGYSEALLARDASASLWRTLHLSAMAASISAEADHDPDLARRNFNRLREAASAAMAPGGGHSVAEAKVQLQLGDLANLLGDGEKAHAFWRQGLEQFTEDLGSFRPEEILIAAELMVRLGERDRALRAVKRLETLGYRHPAYIAFMDGLGAQ